MSDEAKALAVYNFVRRTMFHYRYLTNFAGGGVMDLNFRPPKINLSPETKRGIIIIILLTLGVITGEPLTDKRIGKALFRTHWASANHWFRTYAKV